MRILLITDAWAPQVNGVVRTLQTVLEVLRKQGHEIEVVHPALFKTIPCPTYPEIRLAMMPKRGVARVMDAFRPDAVHIATEGPLGSAGRKLCIKRGWPFTTSFHTRFPEYIQKRCGLPASISYKYLRRWHARAARVMVATETVERDLQRYGFENTARWSRGVDTELFRPQEIETDIPRPIYLYVGRVAVEKNIRAFLDLELDGTQVVIGDGPARPKLEARYPKARFLGAKFGEELAAGYAMADVFTFPSRTDTYGLVMLEALACGVPVAAYPVSGPLDVVGGTEVAVLDEDLGKAAKAALELDRAACRAFALERSWEACAQLFFSLLEPFGGETATRGAA